VKIWAIGGFSGTGSAIKRFVRSTKEGAIGHLLPHTDSPQSERMHGPGRVAEPRKLHLSPACARRVFERTFSLLIPARPSSRSPFFPGRPLPRGRPALCFPGSTSFPAVVEADLPVCLVVLGRCSPDRAVCRHDGHRPYAGSADCSDFNHSHAFSTHRGQVGIRSVPDRSM
jgi:hypothetical protein